MALEKAVPERWCRPKGLSDIGRFFEPMIVGNGIDYESFLRLGLTPRDENHGQDARATKDGTNFRGSTSTSTEIKF